MEIVVKNWFGQQSQLGFIVSCFDNLQAFCHEIVHAEIEANLRRVDVTIIGNYKTGVVTNHSFSLLLVDGKYYWQGKYAEEDLFAEFDSVSKAMEAFIAYRDSLRADANATPR